GDEVARVMYGHAQVERRWVGGLHDLVDLGPQLVRGVDAPRLDRGANQNGQKPTLLPDVVAARSRLLVELVGRFAEPRAHRLDRKRRGWIDELEVAAGPLLDLVVVALAHLVVDLLDLVERRVEQLVVLEKRVRLAVAGVDRTDPLRTEGLDPRHDR